MADVLGEEAEEELDQEVGGRVRVLAAGLERGRDLAEAGGGLLGDVVDRALRLQHSGWVKRKRRMCEIGWSSIAAERDLVRPPSGW